MLLSAVVRFLQPALRCANLYLLVHTCARLRCGVLGFVLLCLDVLRFAKLSYKALCCAALSHIYKSDPVKVPP